MATKEINAYYDVTRVRETRTDLRCAIDLVGEQKIAIDCGCGAGADIAFLRDNGFIVHAFDIESESISRCTERFRDDEKVYLSQDSFSSFKYPNASLISADASLFFCPEHEFDHAWRRITDSLIPDGIFSGSFLGPNDTMASPVYDKVAFWPEVLVFTEDQLKPRFEDFDIVRWTEHDAPGETAQGKPHHWHIFSVVAKKNMTSG